MSRRFYFLYLVAVIIVINYSSVVFSSASKNGIEFSNNKKLELKVDLKEETKLQEAVDSGHEPWRLEAIDVAYEAIISNVDKNAKYENCSSISETQNEAIIKYKGKKTYLVTVKKLIRPNKNSGIWTAVVIEEGDNK